MNLKNQNILFLTRTMMLGGTENVILQLCEILLPKANKIVVCSCGGVNVKKLQQMGIKHVRIPDMASKRPREIITTLSTIKKIIKEEQISVIHSHHRMAALYARVAASKEMVRLANAHNTFQDKKLLTRMAYKGTKVIAVGNQVRKNLIDFFGLKEHNVFVIHNAVKPFEDAVVPVEELQNARESGYTLIGNVGRLSEQKGMEYFIQAASLVYRTYTNCRFFIIGEGEDESKLREMASRLLPDGVISFTGYRSDVQNVISQLDFVVLSSLWEGLPLTPIEAFSVGKTIVATNVDGTVEIVEDGKNGILVEAANVNALAKGMTTLCSKKKVRKEMEDAAKLTYNTKFSFNQLKENYVDFYDGL